TCYHPLFVFNQLGDVERCALRPGNVHSADSWRAALEPVIARYRGSVKRLYFRGDAAFANPEIYEFLEGENIGYTIRLPANTGPRVRPLAGPRTGSTRHRFAVTHWSREHLMDEHISRFKADADDPSHLPDHGVRPGFRLLLQSFLTRLLDLPDLADDKAQPRHVALQD